MRADGENAMEQLTIRDRDVRQLRDVLELCVDQDGIALPWSMLHQLKDLLNCDAIAFNGMDSASEQHYFMQEVGWEDTEAGRLHTDPAGEDRSFWTAFWSTEPCSYPDVSGDLASVVKVSDFYSDRQWRSTPMFDYLGPNYVHELMVHLPDGARRTVKLLCIRGPGADFGERERFLLQLLRPHLADAYRSSLRRRAESRLTGRQREILELLRTGMTNRQIARHLEVSEGTVRTHLNNIYTRLQVGSRTEAAMCPEAGDPTRRAHG